MELQENRQCLDIHRYHHPITFFSFAWSVWSLVVTEVHIYLNVGLAFIIYAFWLSKHSWHVEPFGLSNSINQFKYMGRPHSF